MRLDQRERNSLEDACHVASAVTAGEHDPAHTALALAVLAVVIAGDNPAARMSLAWAMMQHADELMELHCVNLDEANRACT